MSLAENLGSLKSPFQILFKEIDRNRNPPESQNIGTDKLTHKIYTLGSCQSKRKFSFEASITY